jgi:hypothetical protein
LLLRPFLSFGRRQIDFSSGCARKAYLSVAKGVRARFDRYRFTDWGSVGGEAAHEAVSWWATRGRQADSNTVLKEALAPQTLARLVILALVAPQRLGDALNKARDAIDVLETSETIRNVLSRGPWQVESSLLDRGAALSPDLLGPNSVVELKTLSPESLGDASHVPSQDQVEAYLAWAMVAFGVEPVCQDWRGYILHLHPKIAEASRVVTVDPVPEMAARRVHNRHRLLALSEGAWLPAPDLNECTRCEFSRPTQDGLLLPAACAFHCQTERNWDCLATTQSGECPLLNQCNQYARYWVYERLDLFNRLRGELIAEEEEIASALALAEMAQGGAASLYEGFTVVMSDRGQLRLSPSPELRILNVAGRGDLFELLVGAVRCCEVRLTRIRDGDWILVPETTEFVASPGDRVTLRAIPTSDFPVRAQLNYLDRLQRLEEEPVALRTGERRHSPPILVDRSHVDDITAEAQVVLIDCPDRSAVGQAVRQFMHARPRGRYLLVEGRNVDNLPSECLEMSSDALARRIREQMTALDGGISSFAKEAASRHWRVTRQELFEGLLDPLIADDRIFTDVVVLEAESFPLLGLDRCLALGNRVSLIGTRSGAGPWAESENARASILFVNPMRLILDSSALVLPESVTHVESVRFGPSRAAEGIDLLPGEKGRLIAEIPVISENVTGDCEEGDDFLVSVNVPSTEGCAQQRDIVVQPDVNTTLSRSTIRGALRLLSAGAIERLGSSAEGRYDTSLIGFRVRINRIKLGVFGSVREHRVTLRLPADRAPASVAMCWRNAKEAAAVVAHAAANPLIEFVATSPFLGQCRLIAVKAAEAKLTNLRVTLPDRLGAKPLTGEYTLLISTVVGRAKPSYPVPVRDTARMLPMFIGPWRQIRIFCSPEAKEHHPVLRLLSSKSRESLERNAVTLG